MYELSVQYGVVEFWQQTVESRFIEPYIVRTFDNSNQNYLPSIQSNTNYI